MVINRAHTHALSAAAKHRHSPLTAGQDWLFWDGLAKAANRVKERLKTRQVFQGDGSPRRIQVAYHLAMSEVP